MAGVSGWGLRRGGGSVGGRAGGETGSKRTDAGCDWLEGESGPELITLPEFPSDVRFRLPPLPQLVPNARQLLLSGRRAHPGGTEVVVGGRGAIEARVDAALAAAAGGGVGVLFGMCVMGYRRQRKGGLRCRVSSARTTF